MSWLKEVIGTEKAIVAMCHFRAMPGDPDYDAEKGMQYVVDCARHDLIALQNGGVDAVMFSNEFSLPYLTKVRTETVASMARVIAELMPDIKVPYGVNCLWDPYASLELAVAVDAKFVREIFTGVYASDFGLWNTNCGDVVRHQHAIGAGGIKRIFNIVPEAAQYLGGRDIKSIAKSTVFNCKPDALAVSGLIAGASTDSQVLTTVKSPVPGTVVFANTGCKKETIASFLEVADGAVVGTTFKYDGVFENLVDETRVKAFMDVVKEFRASKGL